MQTYSSSKLGCRSILVLHKLGFDLRARFDDTLNAPIPPRLAKLADELAGYVQWRDLGKA